MFFLTIRRNTCEFHKNLNELGVKFKIDTQRLGL